MNGQTAIEIERYATHHVDIHQRWFTIWHPITCDLDICSIYERCEVAWLVRPESMGVYSLDEMTLTLSSPGPKKRYRVTEVIT